MTVSEREERASLSDCDTSANEAIQGLVVAVEVPEASPLVTNSAALVVAESGAISDEVAVNQVCIYSAAQPVSWSGAGLSIPCAVGSIPTTGFEVSARLPEVLDEIVPFAILL